MPKQRSVKCKVTGERCARKDCSREHCMAQVPEKIEAARRETFLTKLQSDQWKDGAARRAETALRRK